MGHQHSASGFKQRTSECLIIAVGRRGDRKRFGAYQLIWSSQTKKCFVLSIRDGIAVPGLALASSSLLLDGIYRRGLQLAKFGALSLTLLEVTWQ